METISNEIKAKVFAQYLGQQFRYAYAKGGPGTECMNTFWLRELEIQKSFDLAKLILRPLSEISDEDAIEVVKLTYPGGTAKDMRIRAGIVFVTVKENGYILNQNISQHNLSAKAHQYLASRGYDLPHYLLGGMTLKDCGLAVYEVNQSA